MYRADMSTLIEAAEPSGQLAGPENLLAHYAAGNGAYDEFLDTNGQIRETWRQFASGLQSMGAAGLGRHRNRPAGCSARTV